MSTNSPMWLLMLRVIVTAVIGFAINNELIGSDFRSKTHRIVCYCIWLIIGAVNLLPMQRQDFGVMADKIWLYSLVPIAVSYLICVKTPFFQMLTFWSTALLCFLTCCAVGIMTGMLFSGSVAADIAGRLLSCAGIIWFYRARVRKLILQFKQSIHTHWRVIWVPLFLCAMLVHRTLFYPSVLEISTERLMTLGITFLLSAFLFLVIYLTFDEVKLNTEKSQESRIVKVQTDMLLEQYNSMREREEMMRVYRHDQRNHIATMQSLLWYNKVDEALKYLGEMQAALDQATAGQMYCKNPFVNALLNYHVANAKKLGIHVFCTAVLDQGLCIEDKELCVMLSCMLENAQAACSGLPQEQRPGYIRLVVQQDEAQIVVRCENPYSGDIHFDESGLPVSDKPGGGIGIRSIAGIVEKYHGMLHVQGKGEVFKVFFTIPLTAPENAEKQ